MTDLSLHTIGEIAKSNVASTSIFRKYGIDYSYRSWRPLSEVCNEAKINLKKILREISSAKESDYPQNNYEHWNVDLTIHYITHTHHSYARKQIQTILDLAANFQGKKEGGIIKSIHPKFLELSGLIEETLLKEELSFYNVLDTLAEKEKQEIIINLGEAHSLISKKIEDLRNAISTVENHKQLEAWEKKYIEALLALDKDLVFHLHLENNILFPKIIQKK